LLIRWVPFANPLSAGQVLPFKTLAIISIIMRTIHFYLFLSLTAIGIFSCQGCDDDEVPCNDPTNMDCHNYDPCHDRKTPVSADFEVRQVGYDESIIYYGDTFPGDVFLRFVALDSMPGTTYAWEVGNAQNTSTNISYRLSFDCEATLNQTIPVRLIAERSADNDCLLPEDRRDTIVRNVHFVPRSQCLYWGQWEGYLENNPEEIYTIELGHQEVPPCASPDTIFIQNIKNDGTCERRFISDSFLGYREAWFEETPGYRTADGCPPPAGFTVTGLRDVHIRVNSASDSIRIQFKYVADTQAGPGQLIEDLVFKGRRVE